MADFLYTNLGKMNQKSNIIKNHMMELVKKASGEIFLKKNMAAVSKAKTFTRIIITLISFRLMK
jgi:hypothetical protein